mmetsp:Transcript_14358/g.36075  ORF Transcript_14358/g.36075 Transcript_14358/m.36075 type:complete len:391 (+) Transcript_14358:204-1376(+)
MTSSTSESDQRGDATADISEPLHDIPINPEETSSANTDDKKEGTQATATPTTQEEGLVHEEMPELESPELEIGDHVYQWRSLIGIPYMFQHHGIVMDVIKDEEGKPIRLTIADFSNVETKGDETKRINFTSGNETSTNSQKESLPNPEDDKDESEILEAEPSRTSQKRGSSLLFSSRELTSRQVTLEQEGLVRTYTDTDKWHKVHYQSGWWARTLNRSGTVTGSRSDPVGLVLARVNFIMQHPDKLPDYHVFHANCECVAFWCKTGNWSTLQASSFLELTAAGQAKSTATLASVAAGTTATVTVPASGIWGSWFGFTTTSSVSWLSLHPMAIPGLACYAAVTVGVPAVMYATAHKKWKETSERMSEDFWNSATENPDVFAECLTHWSEKG